MMIKKKNKRKGKVLAQLYVASVFNFWKVSDIN